MDLSVFVPEIEINLAKNEIGLKKYFIYDEESQ